MRWISVTVNGLNNTLSSTTNSRDHPLMQDVVEPKQLRPPDRPVVFWRSRLQNGAMPSIQVKDVPSETHAVLRRRAAAAHQSLQEYLRARLIEEAATPTVAEVMDRAGGRAGGSVPFAAATEALRVDRDRR